MLPKKYRSIRAGRRIRQDTSFEAIGENLASLAIEPVADFT